MNVEPPIPDPIDMMTEGELRDLARDQIKRACKADAERNDLQRRIDEAPRASTSIEMETLIYEGTIETDKEYSIVELKVQDETNFPNPQDTKNLKGRSRHIGYFDTAQEASKAYQKKAVELFGEFVMEVEK